MLKFKSKRKTSRLLIAVVSGLLLSINLQAQDRPDGLFGQHKESECRGMLRDGGSNSNYNITNEDFGEGVPIGSGLAILLGGGLVYVTLKKKEDKQ